MRLKNVARGLVALAIAGCSSNSGNSSDAASVGGSSGATSSESQAGAGGGTGGSASPSGGRAGLGGSRAGGSRAGGGTADGGTADGGTADGGTADGGTADGGNGNPGGALSTGGRHNAEGGSADSGGASTSGGTGAEGGASGSTTGGSSSTDDIGAWTDAPGACPDGMDQVDITTETELREASRGDGSYESDPASVCYFIHDGTYEQAGSTVSMYVTRGGTDATHRRIFRGESRSGVIVKGRANVESGANHVQITNLTFDLTGFSQDGSFNTLNLSADCTDLRIDHVTFTGDCQTGANGGHVEVDGASDVIVEACLIEKFGRCGPDGHQDHGVYLASGSDITIRNNEIRGNASRGIQFNTQGGEYGTLDDVTIERNRIHDNGHADYEDGIVMNATGTGTISNVTIQRNLIYANYYSGIRASGDVFESIVIRNNTFYRNGEASSGSGRSELNLDDVGSGAETSVTGNIIVAANRVLNDCYDSEPRSYLLTDNVVQGTVPSGDSGHCISGSSSVDPMFVDASGGDFHTENTAVNGYGAYAP